MKKLILLFNLFLIFTVVLKSQNLVPNPGFEDTAWCPKNFHDIDAISQWFWARESPNTFHSCTGDTLGQVPLNGFGYQQDQNGSSYSGMFTGGSIDNFREITGIKLLAPLTSGEMYFVTFNIARAEGNYYWSRSASNKIGARFSNTFYDHSMNPAPVDNFAHVYADSIITDTNWTVFSDSFIASQPYEYLYIGNFFDNNHTDTVHFNKNTLGAYYYIDDVCVTKTKGVCREYTGNATLSSDNNPSIEIFPNPVIGHFTIKLRVNQKKEIFIYDAFGRMVFQKNLNEDEYRQMVPAENWAAGWYLVVIENKGERWTKKIFIQ